MPWTVAEARALAALRLNRQFPPWRALAGHLEAIQLALPGAPRCALSGWPEARAWAQVAVDQRLAGELLQRLAFLEEAGDALARSRGEVLRGLQGKELLPPGGLTLRAIQRSAGRYELVLDRLEPEVPRFVRWTLRGGLPVTSGGQLDEGLKRALMELTEQPCATVWSELGQLGLELEELVRGEIGPLRLAPGGPWVSAVLSRATAGRAGLSVDDPLARGLPVPEPGAGFGFSRQRKWAVPERDRSAARSWLDAVRSRNIVYTYGAAR
jgi:hypothetical protein